MRKVLIITLIYFILSCFGSLNAQDKTCEKWDIVDINFKVRTIPEDPFSLHFGAVFRHESGVEMDVPGFYDDDKTYVLRFSPHIEGKWSYQTYSVLPVLSGKTGGIIATLSTKQGRHGAIKVCPKNQQRFIYEDGTPYFSLAFEIDWLFALDAENQDDIPRTRQIVQHMADFRFNKAIMNVYAYDAGWGEREKIDSTYNFSRPSVFPFGGINENPDHSTLNISFFKHFDRVMMELHDKDIVSHLMIYVWNKYVNWPKPGSPEDNRYFDYVVKRYQAFPNLIWDISKEALAYGRDDMDYITERIDRLKKLDGHRRLVTVHDYLYCRTYPEKVDFISIQEWRPNLYNEMLDVAKRHPNKPVYNVEHGAYEKTMHSIFNGAFVEPDIALERSYICIFAGTYSTYYWQNTSWYELVYDPFSLPAENQPNFKWYKILMDFFSNYDFNKLVPTQYFYSPFCLSDEDRTFIYLMPRGAFALEGMPPRQARNKNVEVQWFNPLTGEYSAVEKRKLGDWTGFRKPASITSPFSLAIMRVVE